MGHARWKRISQGHALGPGHAIVSRVGIVDHRPPVSQKPLTASARALLGGDYMVHSGLLWRLRADGGKRQPARSPQANDSLVWAARASQRARQNQRNRQISPVLHMSVRAQSVKNGASLPIGGAKGGSMQPDSTDVRSGRLAVSALRRRLQARRKGALDPWKNRHFPPFSTTFSAIFTGFFCELAHQGANSRECGPGKRQFFEPRANWVRAAILNELPFLAHPGRRPAWVPG
jgi:hypothetical protein